MDEVRAKYSFKHPTLISFTVESSEAQEWNLPAYNLRNDHKYLHRLHTIDIYLWTEQDAIQLVNSLRRVLSPQQLIILDEPVIQLSHYGLYVDSFVQTVEDLTISTSTSDIELNSTPRRLLRGPPVSATPYPYSVSSYIPLEYNSATPVAFDDISHSEKNALNDDNRFDVLKVPPAKVILTEAVHHENKSIIDNFLDDRVSISEEKHISKKLLHLNRSSSMGNLSKFISPNSSSFIAPQNPMISVPDNSLCTKLISKSPPSPHLPNRFSSPCSTSPVSSPSDINNQRSSYSETTQINHDLLIPFKDYPTAIQTPRMMFTPNMTKMDLSRAEAASNDSFKSLYTHRPGPPIEQQMNYVTHPKSIRETQVTIASKPTKSLKTPLKPPLSRFEEQAAKLERGVGHLLKKLERRIG